MKTSATPLNPDVPPQQWWLNWLYCVHPKSLTLWPPPLFLVVVVSCLLARSLFLSFPHSLSLPLSGWSEMSLVGHRFCVWIYMSSVVQHMYVNWKSGVLSPLEHVLVVSQTHLTCNSFTFLVLFLSQFSGSLCSVLCRTSRALSGCGSAGRSHCYSFGPGLFPRLKELSFPLVHADLSGLSNLLVKCLYFYSCLCGNVY